MEYKRNQIRLAIVDDHNLFRKGLITLLNLAYKNNYIILFEAENGRDMIHKIDKKALPDIIIVDIDMPDMDGFEAVAWLQDHYPKINILVISMIETEEAIVRMLKMGVKGFLSKDIEVEDIYEAIKAIMNKGYYYTDFITGKLISSLRSDSGNKEIEEENSKGKYWSSLSENERKFLELSCSELTYEKIAQQMFLSPKTIDSYRESVFSKFKVKTRVGMVLFAIQNGLINLPAKNNSD